MADTRKSDKRDAGASQAPKPARIRGWRLPRLFWALMLFAFIAGAVGWAAGCGGWDPSEPFDRNAPDVDRAIELMDAGQFESAEEALEAYLATGECNEGVIGLPPSVRDKYNGSFDLGLTLFYLAEKYGARFGDEENTDAGPEQDELDAKRANEIDCALIVVVAIASDAKVPADLRARAFYLAGNLEFLRRKYEASVEHYDRALGIVPGLFPEAGGDSIGRDAAWNRAIALRRIQDQKDAGQDAEPDAEPDAQPDAQPDAEPDSGGDDGGDDGGGDDGGDDGGGQDAGPDGGDQDAGQDGGDDDKQQPPPPSPDDQEQAQPEEQQSQMDRLLDELEEAPTYQEQDAKQRAARRRSRQVMEDK